MNEQSIYYGAFIELVKAKMSMNSEQLNSIESALFVTPLIVGYP